jgi:hypothetical protein
VRLAALDQEAINEASSVFVIAAVFEGASRRYRAVRVPRYVPVGHGAQSLLLTAVALGLGDKTDVCVTMPSVVPVRRSHCTKQTPTSLTEISETTPIDLVATFNAFLTGPPSDPRSMLS